MLLKLGPTRLCISLACMETLLTATWFGQVLLKYGSRNHKLDVDVSLHEDSNRLDADVRRP